MSQVYIYIPAGKYSITIKTDEKEYVIEYSEWQLIYNIGKHKDGDNITIEIVSMDEALVPVDEIKKYAENESVLEQYYRKITDNGIQFTAVRDSHLLGTYTSERENQCIVTTIPYDNGWSVFVDGYEVDLEKNWGRMLAFRVNKGEHMIDMRYTPKGLYGGFMITIISIIMSLLYCKWLSGHNFC